MAYDRPKDTDNPRKLSIGNAVDRASSVTPLDDDSHLDPATIKEAVRAKQESEHAKPGNPQVGPGPVKTSSDRIDGGHREIQPTPKAIEEEIQDSPKEKAKEASKHEDGREARRKSAQHK